MKNKFLITMLLTISSLASANEEISRGKTKSVTCAACHGANGISQNPLWPNLAGQKKDYILKQLKDLKEGRRQDPIMSPMAMTLSEQDMVDLGSYYSSL